MQALSIGAKGIIGVDVHADLPEVCRVLGENHLKKVPVLDEGQVVGVINRSDITHYSMEQYLAERGDEALATGSGEGQGPTKLERAEEAAALPTTRPWRRRSRRNAGTSDASGDSVPFRTQGARTGATALREAHPVASRRAATGCARRLGRLCGRRLGRNASPAEPFL